MKLHFNKGEVTDGWNTDPFVLTENDNKLYGLGAYSIFNNKEKFPYFMI